MTKLAVTLKIVKTRDPLEFVVLSQLAVQAPNDNEQINKTVTSKSTVEATETTAEPAVAPVSGQNASNLTIEIGKPTVPPLKSPEKDQTWYQDLKKEFTYQNTLTAFSSPARISIRYEKIWTCLLTRPVLDPIQEKTNQTPFYQLMTDLSTKMELNNPTSSNYTTLLLFIMSHFR